MIASLYLFSWLTGNYTCFLFDPKQDITSYELALVIKSCGGCKGNIEVPNDSITFSPVARHFKPCEEK